MIFLPDLPFLLIYTEITALLAKEIILCLFVSCTAKLRKAQ